MVFDFHFSRSNTPKLMSVKVPYICYTAYVFDPWSIKLAILKPSTMPPLFDFEPNPNLRCDKICYHFFLDFFRVIFNLGFIFYFPNFNLQNTQNIKDIAFKCDG